MEEHITKEIGGNSKLRSTCHNTIKSFSNSCKILSVQQQYLIEGYCDKFTKFNNQNSINKIKLIKSIMLTTDYLMRETEKVFNLSIRAIV